MRPGWLIRPEGAIAYGPANEAMHRLAERRLAGEIPDTLVLLEHAPVFTAGRRARPEELLWSPDDVATRGAEVHRIDRGGSFTFHGPGQLVGYPIVSLKPYGDDVHDYVRRMERAVIETLGELGIEAGTIDGLTGVWTGGRKIGSIGIHISRGITTHGLAINVNNDLQPFEWIVPCGIEGVRMTSVARELGAEQDLPGFGNTLSARFADLYERRAQEVDARELARRVEGTDALAGLEAALP